MAAWVAEYGYQPPERPATSAILHRLNKEVDSWGKLIIPPHTTESTGGIGYRVEYDGKFFFFTTKSWC